MVIYNIIDKTVIKYYYNESLLKKHWLIEKSTEVNVSRERLLELLDILTISLILNDYTHEVFKKPIFDLSEIEIIKTSMNFLKRFLNQKPSKIYKITSL